MKLRLFGGVLLSVTSMLLGLLAPMGTTAPNPGYAHRVVINGQTFWTNDNGATVTGAVPADAARGFVPSSHGLSFGPDTQTDHTCTQPPAQTVRDHAAFSPAELAAYGLPAQMAGQSRAEWEQIVRSAKTRTCTVATVYQDGQPARDATPTHSVVKPSIPNFVSGWIEETSYTPNSFTGWGIDEIIHPETEVVAYWHFPKLQLPGHLTDASSAWVGLGIDGPPGNGMCQGYPSLVQAGTVSRTEVGSPTYYPFIQNLGSASNCGEDGFTGFISHPGDLMYVAIIFPNTAFLQDQTTGVYYNDPVIYSTDPGAYEGSSTCTVEESGSNGRLANFGTVDFQYCRTQIQNSDGTKILYPLAHVPGASLTRHTQVSAVDHTTDCAFANMFNNPSDPTWPDTSFNVNYEGAGVNGC